MTEPKVQPFDVSSGTSVMVGVPAEPIAPEPTAAIARAVAGLAEVREAHLPQIYIPGVSERPAQCLVLFLERGADTDRVMARLGPILHAIVPSGLYLDVWPLPPDHELLPAVRAANCQLFARVPRRTKWWQVWRS